MNVKEIKAAVDDGKIVHWASNLYVVIKDKFDQYLIHCTDNDNCIGLTHQDGTTLNGDEGEFFIEMQGTINVKESWEKQTVYDLDNGAQVTVEYSHHYDDMVTCIEYEGKRWRCCNGLADLPEFAQPWIEKLDMVATVKLVRPKFKIKHTV